MSEMAILRQLVPLFSSDTLFGTDMEESAKRRRAKLIEEIRRHRQSLEVIELADRLPSSARVVAAHHKQDIAEKLRLLNEELHDLNVQLIREGLSAKPTSNG